MNNYSYLSICMQQIFIVENFLTYFVNKYTKMIRLKTKDMILYL